ncbi:thymus-specific serine protease-like [Tubulanus polymorphus]|uniref:thymus-specific serine protease-like n=1 Tax=Tubulanus polymorphus TaxID=672921 RepID=UPI003DA62E86
MAVIMKFECICVLMIGICLIAPTLGLMGGNFLKIRERVENYKRESDILKLKERNRFTMPSFTGSVEIEPEYLTQPLDHFDPRVTLTYQQRHWANDEFWRKPDGPVFLYIGGEGALSSLAIQNGHIVELAEKYGALLLAVEHRFYGKSVNDDGLELEYIQYLSSQQALADLASFHHHTVEKYQLTSKNTWICFGGSYPGALSAWFRLKYPHLVFGSIASSAPVRAQTNFQGYNNVVAASLGDPVVKGSKKCVEMVKAAFKKIDKLISSKQYSILEKDFRSCQPLSNMYDINQLVSNLAGNFMGVVQYNNEVPGLNVERICQRMEKSSDGYENLKVLNQELLKEQGSNCTDNSWAHFLKQVMNTHAIAEGVGLRQWLYQTCTQFGYYQTCDQNTDCIFSKYMTLQPNIDICTMVFKIPGYLVDKRIQFSNDYYGADRPKGSRIVFVNGSIDPWHALSVLKDASASEISIYINGTAHCANMRSSMPTDPEPLKIARIEISSRIGHWLKQAKLSQD